MAVLSTTDRLPTLDRDRLPLRCLIEEELLLLSLLPVIDEVKLRLLASLSGAGTDSTTSFSSSLKRKEPFLWRPGLHAQSVKAWNYNLRAGYKFTGGILLSMEVQYFSSPILNYFAS